MVKPVWLCCWASYAIVCHFGILFIFWCLFAESFEEVFGLGEDVLVVGVILRDFDNGFEGKHGLVVLVELHEAVGGVEGGFGVAGV